MGVVIAKPQHEVAYSDLVALVTMHAANLKPAEILAIAANMVGKLVAMQDQRTMSPAVAMEIVAQNIQAGNQHALEQLKSAGGTAH